MGIPYKRWLESDFVANPSAYDESVSQSPGLLDYCTSSYWTLAANACLHSNDRPAGTMLIASDESESHWLVFARGASWFWEPLENAWSFSCPLVGADPARSLDLLFSYWEGELDSAPAGFLIGGVPAQGGVRDELLNREGAFRRLVEFEGISCMLVDLESGIDAYLARRSTKFCKNIRQNTARCDAAEITFEDGTSNWQTLLDRILRIQQRTEKWLRGDDIFHHQGYLDFYSMLGRRASEDGTLRLLFARRHEEDIAFILGADFRGTYRGLQMSFASPYRNLGVGNVLQLENMRRCVADGVTQYDLGMHAPYKERWTDKIASFKNVLVIL
jgi:hypothetical protein